MTAGHGIQGEANISYSLKNKMTFVLGFFPLFTSYDGGGDEAVNSRPVAGGWTRLRVPLNQEITDRQGVALVDGDLPLDQKLFFSWVRGGNPHVSDRGKSCRKQGTHYYID